MFTLFLGLDSIIKLKGIGMTHNNTPSSSHQSQQQKDCLRDLVQTLMDIEVSQMLSASRYERSGKRRAYRNGYRTSTWNTAIGQIELRIPKLRRGSYYPQRLLNDADISKRLIELVNICIQRGLSVGDFDNMINNLDLLTLSPYEVHQIYDVLHSYSAKSMFASINRYQTSYESEAHQVILQKRDADGQLQIINQTENDDENKEFWRDFTRRMQHAGVAVEDYRSVLSAVNPYALIDETNIIYLIDVAKPSPLIYMNEYLLIA